jgi:hypothetical protein
LTQGQTSVKDFSEDYIEQCFTIWYSLGQTTSMTVLQDAIPEVEGKKPSTTKLRSFRDGNGWIERADALNQKAIEKVEHKLIDMKSDMLKRQAESAFKIAKVAEDYLLENGFDTAASAVSAIKWAQEEERTVRGVSEMMIKISKMSPDELMQEAAKLLKRNSEVIDVEAQEMEAEEKEDADQHDSIED